LLGFGVAVSSEKQAALILPQIGQAVAGTHITPFSNLAMWSTLAVIVLFSLRSDGGVVTHNGKSRSTRGLASDQCVRSSEPIRRRQISPCVDCLTFTVDNPVAAALDGIGV
jgi:hypothetical protein